MRILEGLTEVKQNFSEFRNVQGAHLLQTRGHGHPYLIDRPTGECGPGPHHQRDQASESKVQPYDEREVPTPPALICSGPSLLTCLDASPAALASTAASAPGPPPPPPSDSCRRSVPGAVALLAREGRVLRWDPARRLYEVRAGHT